MKAAIEVGPKGKRCVAVARAWPGLSRGAKTEEAAIEWLESYRARYAPVAAAAGLASEFDAEAGIVVVERYPGTPSTDFWGISFAFSEFDRAEMAGAEFDREIGLMQGAWRFFDDCRARVSEELRKGPRGGGADREQLVRHVLAAERDWQKKLGNRRDDPLDTSQGALNAHRAAYVTSIRTFHAERKPARTWPLRYLIRHTAFHTLDHAWQMEDGDLTGSATD